MSTPSEGPLTQLARSIQADNKRFQQELTAASLQASQNPGSALLGLNQCWNQIDNLEQREMAFLAQMGAFGTQQAASARDAWRQTRLQILIGKAQVLLILGRYDESQAAIDSARAHISGVFDPGAALLDQLEVAVIQAQS